MISGFMLFIWQIHLRLPGVVINVVANYWRIQILLAQVLWNSNLHCIIHWISHIVRLSEKVWRVNLSNIYIWNNYLNAVNSCFLGIWDFKTKQVVGHGLLVTRRYRWFETFIKYLSGPRHRVWKSVTRSRSTSHVQWFLRFHRGCPFLIGAFLGLFCKVVDVDIHLAVGVELLLRLHIEFMWFALQLLCDLGVWYFHQSWSSYTFKHIDHTVGNDVSAVYAIVERKLRIARVTCVNSQMRIRAAGYSIAVKNVVG